MCRVVSFLLLFYFVLYYSHIVNVLIHWESMPSNMALWTKKYHYKKKARKIGKKCKFKMQKKLGSHNNDMNMEKNINLKAKEALRRVNCLKTCNRPTNIKNDKRSREMWKCWKQYLIKYWKFTVLLARNF